jgi:mannose-6-phosphate isomerase
MKLYPICFEPIFMERVWGGSRMAELYGKALPPGKSIGESWEISDRPEGVSRIRNGPLEGKDLRWLMEQHGKEILGPARSCRGRFPLLVKILDAREKLSLQVHPPPHVAASLVGEPKTEMWYITDADPGAELYVGLKRGTTRSAFESRLAEGTVAECFHVHQVEAGDAMFLPSGRVHGLGSGLVLFEVQQNSDTTYRVFDWNRVGLDGKPRALHVKEAMASINFYDFEPPLLRHSARGGDGIRDLVKHELFQANLQSASAESRETLRPTVPTVIGVVSGTMELVANDITVNLAAGDFCLLPASLGESGVDTCWRGTFLFAEAG